MGRLNPSLYGTKDAAQVWAAEYTRTLRAVGFELGRASPCNFYHKTRDLALTVHGGDFTCTGPVEDLACLEEVFRKRYDIPVSWDRKPTKRKRSRSSKEHCAGPGGGLSMRLTPGTARLSSMTSVRAIVGQ